MGIFCAAITLLLGSIAYLGDRKVYNVSALFAFFWGIILLLSSLCLYGLYESGDQAYIFITIGVGFFCLGEILGEKFTCSVRYKRKLFLVRDKNKIDVRMFYLLFTVCIICLIPDIKMILYFIRKGFDLNKIYYTIAMNSAGAATDISNVQFGSDIQQIVKIYVGYPLLYLLISTSLVCFMQKPEKKYFLCMLILTAFRFLADLKRTLLVMLVLMFIFFFVLLDDARNYKRNECKGSNKFKKRYIFIVLCGFVFLYTIISKLRRGNDRADFSFLRNLYFYYVGCIKYFDIRIENQLQLNVTHTLGFFSLRGLISPICSLLERLGINILLFSDASDALASLHNIVYSVAVDQRFNSYATAFYEFYIDGGVPGIILGSTIFGWIGGKYYSDYKTTHSLMSCLKLGYFISVFLLFSMLQISSIINYLIWPLILCPVIFKKVKRSEVA